MKLFIRFTIFLLALCLSGLVITFHITNTITNPQHVDSALKKSHSYQYLSDQTIKLINQQIDKQVDPQIAPQLKDAVNRAVTPKLVSQAILPSLSQLVDWFKNGSSNLPAITIDTTAINKAIIESSSSTVDQAKLAEARFELTRVLPEKIDVTNANPSDDIASKPTELSGIQSAYMLLNRALIIQLGITIFLLLLVVFASTNKRTKMLRRPAVAFFLAAFFVAFLSWPIVQLLNHTVFSPSSTQNQQLLTISRGIGSYLLAGLVPYAIGLAIIGLVLYLVSFFMPKSAPDKIKK